MNQKRSYVKLSFDEIIQLQNLVFKEHYSIKQASVKLNIKYSRAKQVVQQKRRNTTTNIETGGKNCQFRKIQKEILYLRIISKFTGELQSSKLYEIHQKVDDLQQKY